MGVSMIAFELSDLRPTYLACWFTLIQSRPCLKIRVIGHTVHGRRMKNVPVSLLRLWLQVAMCHIVWNIT